MLTRAPGDTVQADVAQLKRSPPPGRSPQGASVPSYARSEHPRPASKHAADQRTRAAHSVRQREALVLRYYGDLSEAEIAAVMGISRGAVKSHTARAMAALRAVLEQQT